MRRRALAFRASPSEGADDVSAATRGSLSLLRTGGGSDVEAFPEAATRPRTSTPSEVTLDTGIV